MKKQTPYLIAVAFLLMACSISVNLTPEPSNPSQPQAPIVVTATTAAPTEPPAPPVVQVNVTCNGLSFYLDPALGSGYNCQTIAESSGADLPYFAINPEYTEISLQSYVLSDTFFPPHIDVFPVQRYSQLIPDVIDQHVATMQGLIAGGAPGANNVLPLLPPFNAGQVFYAQYAVIPFQNGSGIRYITMYSQAVYPVNNHEIFYSFQGLSGDGQYWISLIFPINNPILPSSGDTPPNGQSWDDFNNNFESYLSDITEQLNAQSPGSFYPTINMLDALVNSMVIQP